MPENVNAAAMSMPRERLFAAGLHFLFVTIEAWEAGEMSHGELLHAKNVIMDLFETDLKGRYGNEYAQLVQYIGPMLEAQPVVVSTRPMDA